MPPVIRSLFLAAALLLPIGNAYAHPDFPGVAIHYDRCGAANPNVTLCIARSEAGNVYVVTLNPGRGPGFVAVTETVEVHEGYTRQVFSGAMPILTTPDGPVVEHHIVLTLKTQDKSPWKSHGSMTMDGKAYYPSLDFSQDACPY
jgi:hypothetical protein